MRQALVGGIIEASIGTCREEKPMRIEAKLEQLGFVLPEAPKISPGVQVSFAWVRVYQDRAYVAGHGPQNPMARLHSRWARLEWTSRLRRATKRRA